MIPWCFAQVGVYLFGTEFAADKGVDVLNQLRIELIRFSLTLFGKPALLLCSFSALYCCPWMQYRLISRLMVLLWRLSCLAISVMVQWRTGIRYGIVRLGSVVCSSWQSFLQERPYAPPLAFFLWKVALQMRIRRRLSFGLGQGG